MALKRIGKFNLRNGGGFVCRGKVAYEDEDGQTIMTEAETGDILLGQAGDVDPGALGVPNGAKVWLYVVVIGGSNNQASQAFQYESGSPKMANYVITGTTLGNYLGLISIT